MRGSHVESQNFSGSNWGNSSSSSRNDRRNNTSEADDWGIGGNSSDWKSNVNRSEPMDDDWGASADIPVKKHSGPSVGKSEWDDDWNGKSVNYQPSVLPKNSDNWDDNWGGKSNHHQTKIPPKKSHDWEDGWNKEPSQTKQQHSGVVQMSEDSRVVRVPSSRVGSVIGRGGSKINELQDRSRARIKVF